MALHRNATRLAAAGFVLAVAAMPVVADPPPRPMVDNRSVPTRCAEEDNVYFTLSEPGIRSFRVEAVAPPYMDEVERDSTAPDFAHCDMSRDPAFRFEPRRETLFENDELIVVGFTVEQFWRKDTARVSIAGKDWDGLHFLQLWRRTERGPIEYLVVYPGDGYWRLKLLPPARFDEVAYGSSFLIGPIEENGRPFVDLDQVTFDPESLTFGLRFRKGGSGRVAVREIGLERAVLDVTLEGEATAGLPFAALRSMYVAPSNADASEIAWGPAPGEAERVRPIMAFEDAPAAQVRFGRRVVSLHNTSAPDIVFGHFGAGASDE